MFGSFCGGLILFLLFLLHYEQHSPSNSSRLLYITSTCRTASIFMGNNTAKHLFLSTAHKVWQIFIYTQRDGSVCTRLSFGSITLTTQHASFSLDTSKQQLPFRLLYQCVDGAWWQISATENEKNANLVWNWIQGDLHIHDQCKTRFTHFRTLYKNTCIHR